MRDRRRGGNENDIAIISGCEREVGVSTLANDRAPFTQREMSHCARCFRTDTTERLADLSRDIHSPAVEIEASADFAAMVEEQSRLVAIAHDVCERIFSFWSHAAASAWPGAISMSSVLSIP
jgi:hypothetical protein